MEKQKITQYLLTHQIVPTNNYVWSNGIIDTIIYNLSPGVYSVNYTDQNGCFAIDSVQVGESALISVFADSNQTICYGGQPNNLTSQSFNSLSSSNISGIHLIFLLTLIFLIHSLLTDFHYFLIQYLQ